jgi:hypothetical protein
MTKLYESTLSILALTITLIAPAALADAYQTKTPQRTGVSAFNTTKVNSHGFTSMAAKKGGSGVDMAYRIEGTPEVGKPLTIRIQMTSPVDAQAQVSAAEGLTLDASSKTMASPAGQSTEHTVVVVPQALGRFYLDVFTQAAGRASASAIPIQVGKGAVQNKLTGTTQTMPNGERVISVPSQP